MTKATTIGIGLGVGLILIVAVIVFRKGSSDDTAVPAAIGASGAEDDGDGYDGSHVTHHPVVVTPKDNDGDRGLGAASPAGSPTSVERSPAARDNTSVPDSFSPHATIPPIRDSLDTGEFSQGLDGFSSWPDGRPPIAPSVEENRDEPPVSPDPVGTRVGEAPRDSLNIYVPPPRHR